MVLIIKIKDGQDMMNLASRLNKLKLKMPAMTRGGMKEWGEKSLERNLKKMVIASGITPFTGGLLSNGIEYKQGKTSNKGFLYINDYGVKLDGMHPHHVRVDKRRTELLTWASRARLSTIRKRADKVLSGKRKSFPIRVTPHPFIESGFIRAVRKLNPMLKRWTKRGMRI